MDEYAQNAQSSRNEGKSINGTHAGSHEGPSAVNGAQDTSEPSADIKAAELEEFNSILNFTNDKFFGDILRRFEERYKEGDCLHLAKLYYRERDGKPFVDYMKNIASRDRGSQYLPGDQDLRWRFASYWIGWDAQEIVRFQKPGPCIGDHVVLWGAIPTPSEFEFMRGSNGSPRFDQNMILERSCETDMRPSYRFNSRTPHSGWYQALDWMFYPKDDSDPKDNNDSKNNNEEAFYALQTVSRLREAFDDPSQSPPSQVSIDDSEREECLLSAVWISMSHQDRINHLEKIESGRAIEQAKLDSRTKNGNHGQPSKPSDRSSILSFGQDHSARTLSHRKHDA